VHVCVVTSFPLGVLLQCQCMSMSKVADRTSAGTCDSVMEMLHNSKLLVLLFANKKRKICSDTTEPSVLFQLWIWLL